MFMALEPQSMVDKAKVSSSTCIKRKELMITTKIETSEHNSRTMIFFFVLSYGEPISYGNPTLKDRKLSNEIQDQSLI